MRKTDNWDTRSVSAKKFAMTVDRILDQRDLKEKEREIDV
jgi:hypothetical protein